MPALLGAAAFLHSSDAYTCPKSGALIYASCKTTVSAADTCESVRLEMLARVGGQYGSWHDPHNNGTYSVIDDTSQTSLALQRVTGDNKYTDKITFTFEAAGNYDGCVVRGCSRSQVTSVADFSTNYCNMYSLYCSSADGCKYAERDIAVTETEVKPSSGASKDKSACLKV